MVKSRLSCELRWATPDHDGRMDAADFYGSTVHSLSACSVCVCTKSLWYNQVHIRLLQASCSKDGIFAPHPVHLYRVAVLALSAFVQKFATSQATATKTPFSLSRMLTLFFIFLLIFLSDFSSALVNGNLVGTG